MPEKKEYQNILTELRRGSLTMAVLALLRKPHYGYALLQTMEGVGIDMEANTLYPLLRRLESQGLLKSDWDTTESRPRKYYEISTQGYEVLQMLLKELERIQSSMDKIIEDL